ncbi:unnamed protein product [Nippostrongylus brasiliensis]|uniref:CHZ domain-containing protein n=1 Tax=Nippostrongylus brasiliensis TaxID=27835 RepID=A0A0N4YEF7_NIPBR|nr:unnamed protein product [Nippostrongylus brasiliensis]
MADNISQETQETTTPQETIDEDFGDPFDSPEDETAADSGAGSTVEEEHQSPMEHRHSSAVASKIHKRKVPVRRPTAYVSGRDGADDDKDDVEHTDTGETATAQVSDTAQKPIPADTRLRELSKKYKSQDRSPDSEEAD